MVRDSREQVARGSCARPCLEFGKGHLCLRRSTSALLCAMISASTPVMPPLSVRDPAGNSTGPPGGSRARAVPVRVRYRGRPQTGLCRTEHMPTAADWFTIAMLVAAPVALVWLWRHDVVGPGSLRRLGASGLVRDPSAISGAGWLACGVATFLSMAVGAGAARSLLHSAGLSEAAEKAIRDLAGYGLAATVGVLCAALLARPSPPRERERLGLAHRPRDVLTERRRSSSRCRCASPRRRRRRFLLAPSRALRRSGWRTTPFAH